jgi:hypothetical protein
MGASTLLADMSDFLSPGGIFGALVLLVVGALVNHFLERRKDARLLAIVDAKHLRYPEALIAVTEAVRSLASDARRTFGDEGSTKAHELADRLAEIADNDWCSSRLWPDTYLDISIENRGSTSATKIRVNVPRLVSGVVDRDGVATDLSPSAETIDIGELHAGESVALRVWAHLVMSDVRVTYSEGKARVRTPKTIDQEFAPVKWALVFAGVLLVASWAYGAGKQSAQATTTPSATSEGGK